jgi:hypothetical protein
LFDFPHAFQVTFERSNLVLCVVLQGAFGLQPAAGPLISKLNVIVAALAVPDALEAFCATSSLFFMRPDSFGAGGERSACLETCVPMSFIGIHWH